MAIEHGMPVVLLGPGENEPVNVQCDADADRLFWETVRDKTEARYFETYLERVESGELCGRFASLAEIELDGLTRASEPAAGHVTPLTNLPRERVMNIQIILNELGFDPGPIDGDFGPRSRTAVIEFQRSIDAPATGTISERDEIALAEAFANLRSPQGSEVLAKRKGWTGSGFTNFIPGSTFRDCTHCPEMVVIPTGSFKMGSPEDEEGRDTDEGPQHLVEIGTPFAIGRYEVTRGQFSQFVSETEHQSGNCRFWDGYRWKDDSNHDWRNPGYEQTDNHPVTCVSWEDAQAYSSWLNNKTGGDYRLPSEAEWAYAARAGTTSQYFWGDGADQGCTFANGADQTVKKTHSDWTVMTCNDGYYGTAPIGSFRANLFGLYDITGNLWEWVEDRWHHSYEGAPTNELSWIDGNSPARVLRGGAWNSYLRSLRSAERDRGQSGVRNHNDGFHVTSLDNSSASGGHGLRF